jgi:hypothetical protein
MEIALLAIGLALGGCTAGNRSIPSAPRAEGVTATSPSTSSTATGLSGAGSTGPASSRPVPTAASDEAGPMPIPHLRTVGPEDQGREVVLRVGDRVAVVPDRRQGGWVVADFPTATLRLQGSPAAASSHTFLTIAVGEGQLTLTPAGPEARSASVFTVRIRVLRDIVQPPQS